MTRRIRSPRVGPPVLVGRREKSDTSWSSSKGVRIAVRMAMWALFPVLLISYAKMMVGMASLAERRTRGMGILVAPGALQSKPGPQLKPIFHCADAPIFRNTKLVFVHVFKTAGSTIRNFFDAYSERCHAGWAILIGCSGAYADTIGIGHHWGGMSSRGEPPCMIKRTWNRTGKKKWNTHVSNRYVALGLDILGGHLPLGVEGVWTNSSALAEPKRQQITVNHFTFVRNAFNKYVSGVSYRTKNPSIETVMERMRQDVQTELANSHFQSKYASYFVTPQQRKENQEKLAVLSSEFVTLQQMVNLLEYDVIIGTTERMSDSLHLLETLIDEDGKAADLFAKFGSSRGSMPKKAVENDHAKGSKDATAVINPSQLSTLDIVREMKKDKLLFLDVLDFTRYEQQVADFALALHMRQFDNRPE